MVESTDNNNIQCSHVKYSVLSLIVRNRETVLIENLLPVNPILRILGLFVSDSTGHFLGDVLASNLFFLMWSVDPLRQYCLVQGWSLITKKQRDSYNGQ